MVRRLGERDAGLLLYRLGIVPIVFTSNQLVKQKTEQTPYHTAMVMKLKENTAEEFGLDA